MQNNGCKVLFLSILLIAISSIMVVTSCGPEIKDNSLSVEQPSQSINAAIDTLAPLNEKYKENPELLAADVYAGHYGITEQEALQRFDITDAFSGLGAELESAEAETYAGLWIQHEPSFCVVIAFTQDGEEKIKKYVSENLSSYIEIRTLKYSFAELEQVQREIMTSLYDMDIPFDGGIYVMNNRVEFNVTDRTEIDNAIKDGRLILPECVQINVVEGLAVLL